MGARIRAFLHKKPSLMANITINLTISMQKNLGYHPFPGPAEVEGQGGRASAPPLFWKELLRKS